MKNMIKNRTILTTLGIALIGMMMVGFAANAQGNGHGKGHGQGHGRKGGGIEKAIERLNLTADQKQKIQALRDQFKTTHAATLEQIKTLREQMRTAAKEKNREQVQTLREQMKAKMESLKPAREQLHQQILAILTPEQRAELEKMKSERKEKMQGKKEKKEKKEKGAKKNKGGADQGDLD